MPKSTIPCHLLAYSAYISLTAFLGLIGAGILSGRTANQQAGLPTLAGEEAVRHLQKTGMYQSLGAAVTAVRYRAEEVDERMIASNHANGMRAEFDEAGLLLSSTSKGAEWRSTWRLLSVGYGDEKTPILSGDLTSRNQRVEISRRESHVLEWFENRPDGLEHGFTLSTRPMRERSTTEPLRLAMGVNGDLRVKAHPDGQSLTLTDRNGQEVLRYSNLKVWDASDKEQPARMEVSGNKVILEVEEANATYPLTIDPTFEDAKLLASDRAAGDLFGISVSISGDTAIVGADQGRTVDGPGSAYIFKRNGAIWSQQAELLASDGAAGDEFGGSVSISGDTAIVGAKFAVGTVRRSGAAYVFGRNAGGPDNWGQVTKLTDSDSNRRFGFSVSISEDMVIVGSPADWNIFQTAGSAYIYQRNAGVWTQQAKLNASDEAAFDWFGWSVSTSGDTAIVGAVSDLFSGIPRSSAYIFERNTGGANNWGEVKKLFAFDVVPGDGFGGSVSISGDTAIVGAFSADEVSSDSGSAYIFERNTGGTGNWGEVAKLTASDGAAGDLFGNSVSIFEDTVIVGSFKDDHGAGESGSAYIFERNTGGADNWGEVKKLTASDPASDHLGISVSISGDTAIAGAIGDDLGPQRGDDGTDAGAAYVFPVAPPNSPPEANAGPDQAIRPGDTVHLDGSASFDDNTVSAALEYAWNLASKPLGSAATLSNADTATPDFVADVVGDYEIQLIVTDEGGLSSTPDVVGVSTNNLAPTADAGNDQLVIVNTPVNLDASGSVDPEDDFLSYSWTITSKPAGSSATLSDADTAFPSLVPDLEGIYQATLEVSDLIGPGAPDAVQITATSAEGFSEHKIMMVNDLVTDLTPEEITTKGNQQAILNFLSQAITALQRDDLEGAIHKLQEAIGRTDGCVLRGGPDGNGEGRDWITDCVKQTVVYGLLHEALGAITP